MTGCILFTSLTVIEIVFIGIGTLLILEAAGTQLVADLPINLANLSDI